MKAYLANSLFSEADALYNNYVAQMVRSLVPDVELYVPQENGEINDKSQYATSLMIAQADSKHLLESDFMIAIIDGVEIDSGVAFEMGKFSMTGRPIYALFTDIRQGNVNEDKIDALKEDALENPFIYRNLYVIGEIKLVGNVYSKLHDLISAINDDIDASYIV